MLLAKIILHLHCISSERYIPSRSLVGVQNPLPLNQVDVVSWPEESRVEASGGRYIEMCSLPSHPVLFDPFK